MKAPHSFTIALTPDQFKALQAKFASSETAGHIDQHDVSLDWSYNAALSQLDVNVTAVHSFMAEHAPDDLVEGHIKDFIAKA